MSSSVIAAIGRLEEAARAFDRVDLTYPKGTNAVLPANDSDDPDTVALLRRLRESDLASLEVFYHHAGGISLPDVGSGLFIHSPAQILRELDRGAPLHLWKIDGPRVFPFGSDGGGSLFAMGMDAQVLQLTPAAISEGVYASDPSGDGDGPKTAVEPHAGLANACCEKGELSNTMDALGL